MAKFCCECGEKVNDYEWDEVLGAYFGYCSECDEDHLVH